MKASIKQYSQTLLEMTDGKSEQEVLGIVKNFAGQLKSDGQLKNASKIMEKFADIYNAQNGIVDAQVITRFEMGDSDLRSVEKLIKEKYSAKSVEIENIVDEKIKGGIVIKVGDEILDASVNGQIERLRKILIK